MSDVLIEARDLTQDYVITSGFLQPTRHMRAVKGVSFTVARGRTLAIVGESGSGKSTLARIVALIDRQSGGSLKIAGEEIDIGRHRPGPRLRGKVQIVFQNPYGSLNPRQKIGDVLMEPLQLNTSDPAGLRREKAEAMLAKVGLAPEHFNRYPHMFSGGQRQRIAIARALMLNPEVLVLDEPVSALDLSVQAQVLNLLADLQDELGLTYLFISHDLSVVRYLADEVLVMNRGEAVEHATRDAIFAAPQHPYTQRLFAATPVTDLQAIKARIARRRAARASA